LCVGCCYVGLKASTRSMSKNMIPSDEGTKTKIIDVQLESKQILPHIQLA